VFLVVNKFFLKKKYIVLYIYMDLIKLDVSKLSDFDKEIYERMPYLFDNNIKNNIVEEFLKLSESNKDNDNKDKDNDKDKD